MNTVDWRKQLVEVVIPQGEGDNVPLSFRAPEKLVARIEAIAKATDNNRTDVILGLLRAAVTAWEQANPEPTKSKKSA